MEVQVEVVCQNLQVEVRVLVIFKNLQVEAVVPIAGRGSRWRLRLKLSVRICRWIRQCRWLVEAAGGGSGFSFFQNLQVEAVVQIAGRGCVWSFGM